MTQAYVEVRGRSLPELFPLQAVRTTVGRAQQNAIVLSDVTVSELHAVIESYGVSFSVRDLGSSNGTFVNGQRLASERRLRTGDEICVGETRLLFREQRDGVSSVHATAASDGPPDLTQREHDVLVALCRPMLDGATFAQPASIARLASELVVSTSAVKFHLANLYDKFGLHDAGESRRVRLANDAVRRRAVTIADLQGAPGDR